MLDVVLEVLDLDFTPFESIVSILVVLDVVLEVTERDVLCVQSSCFNPCCAGCSSGSLSNAIVF